MNSTPATGLVVDASVVIKWFVDEPGSAAAHGLEGRDMAAPALLRVEVANVMRTLAARQAMTSDDARELFGLLQAAPLTLVDHDDALERHALALALTLRHPVYDCMYLALAERMDRILVTADGRFLHVLGRTDLAARAVVLEDCR